MRAYQRVAPLRGLFAWALALSAAVLPVACEFVNEEIPHDGPSTETGNPALTGVAVDLGLRPAPGAAVVLWKLPPGPAESLAFRAPMRMDSQVTGADGRYYFKKLPPGVYSVEGADKSGRFAAILHKAVVPAGDTGFRRNDTLVLWPASRVHGRARRDPRSRPAGPSGLKGDEGILVRLGGFSRAAYTDSAGLWSIDGIPQGVYSLGFAAADGHYLPKLIDTLHVPAAENIEAPDVLLEWSPFVIPPGPAGLTLRLDSAAGLMRLAWRGVSVSNFHRYEVIRRDSLDAANDDTLRTADTIAIDTLRGLPAGRILRYAVVTVNTLGARSPETPAPTPGTVPTPADTPPGQATLRALVLSGGAPRSGVKVRLHLLPAGPGPADSLPRLPRTMDSALTDAGGLVSYANLKAGRYTLDASAPDGSRAALAGVQSRLVAPAPGATAGSEAVDTLRLAAPGTLKASATRQSVWCTHQFKLDDFIVFHLLDLPGLASSDAYGKVELAGLPAGTRKVVVRAQPFGCFEPDTVTAELRPGEVTELPRVTLRPAADYIPRLAGLRIASATRAAAHLAWSPAPQAYPDLAGYEVLRRDADHKVIAASPLLADTLWSDNLSSLPSGTRINYVVRVTDKAGRRGPPGGDKTGEPVYLTVP